MPQLVVAGDSANDVLMFDAVEKAIAVGNAREELLRVADPVKTYFAKGRCAAGIIEGLRHYGAHRWRRRVKKFERTMIVHGSNLKQPGERLLRFEHSIIDSSFDFRHSSFTPESIFGKD